MSETLADRTWLAIAAALYLGGFLFGTLLLARRRRHSRLAMYAIMSAGFIVQTLGLYVRGLAIGGCPLGNTFEILQFTTWSATALYLLVGATFRVSLLGYFTAALAAGISLVSLAIPAWDGVYMRGGPGGGAWIEFHAALSLFSYGVFALLALTSAMYLLQWRSLKQQQLGGLFSLLPSIRDLDHINLRLLAIGTALLGASLIVGSVYWLKTPGALVNAPKLFLSALWLLYAIALACRLANLLPARRLAWACLALFIVALLTIGSVSSRTAHQPRAGNPAANARQP